MQIGEYSNREKYRLFAFVPTDEGLAIETGGKVYFGDRHSFEGIPIRKDGNGQANTLQLQVHSKGFPTFTAANEPFDRTKSVAPGTLLHFAKRWQRHRMSDCGLVSTGIVGRLVGGGPCGACRFDEE